MPDSCKVLLISPFFAPENISTGRYNTFLVKALSEAGCDVSVICSHPFYPEWTVRKVSAEMLEGVATYRGGQSVRYPRSQVLRRLLLEVWFTLHVARKLRQLRRTQFDIRIDIYPPNFFALVANLVLRDGPPAVGIVHDLQGIMSGGKPSLMRRVVSLVVRPLEGFALRRLESLVFLSKGMLDFAVTNYGVDRGRAIVAYPFSTLGSEAPEESPTPEAMRGSRRSVVYSGALGEKQDPENLFGLLDAFARKRDDFDVFIFSNGPSFERLREHAQAIGSPVNLHGLVTSRELPGLLKASTVQIIPQKLGLSDGAFPSKLPNLVAMKTAVFAVTDARSELSTILDEYSRGMAVHSWNKAEVLVALEKFADQVSAKSGVDKRQDDDIMRKFDVHDLRDRIMENRRVAKGVERE